MPAPKKPKLTVKQKKFADKVLEGKNWTQAALEVYDTEDDVTAASIAYENLRKPQIEAYLMQLWHKARSFLQKVMDWDEIEGKVANIKTRVDVAKHFEDKAFGKAQGKMDVTSNGESLNINIVSFSDIKKEEWQT